MFTVFGSTWITLFLCCWIYVYCLRIHMNHTVLVLLELCLLSRFVSLILSAFTLCSELYSLRVPIYVLFPAFVEEAKINHQLSVHLCTYVTHLSNTKIVGSRPCPSVEHFRWHERVCACEWVQHKRSGVLIEPSMGKKMDITDWHVYNSTCSFV